MARRTNPAENIQHLTGIRIRVRGSGNLKMSVHSYDLTKSVDLPDLVMNPSTNIQPTVLANFVDQRMQLEIKTTDFDAVFTIARIIPFTRTVATGYPQ